MKKQNKKGDIKALSESFFNSAPKFNSEEITQISSHNDTYAEWEKAAKELDKITGNSYETEKFRLCMSSLKNFKNAHIKEKSPIEKPKEKVKSARDRMIDELRQIFSVDKPICLLLESISANQSHYYYKILATIENRIIDFSRLFSGILTSDEVGTNDKVKYSTKHKGTITIFLFEENEENAAFKLATTVKAVLYTPEEIAASPCPEQYYLV